MRGLDLVQDHKYMAFGEVRTHNLFVNDCQDWIAKQHIDRARKKIAKRTW